MVFSILSSVGQKPVSLLKGINIGENTIRLGGGANVGRVSVSGVNVGGVKKISTHIGGKAIVTTKLKNRPTVVKNEIKEQQIKKLLPQDVK